MDVTPLWCVVSSHLIVDASFVHLMNVSPFISKPIQRIETFPASSVDSFIVRLDGTLFRITVQVVSVDFIITTFGVVVCRLNVGIEKLVLNRLGRG